MRGLLPIPEQTLLLRAALLGRDEARRAWSEWSSGRGDPVRALGARQGGARRLLPLLHRAAERFELEARGELRTYLRTAAARDELRHSTYRRILGEVMHSLEAEEETFLVVKGAALAEELYDPPWLRHCHDIDLLVPGERLIAAARALERGGFRAERHQLGGTATHLSLRHPSGLPVSLHANLFRLRAFPAPLGEVEEGSRELVAGDLRLPTLSTVEALLHVLGQAALTEGRRQLTWVSDSYLLVAAHPEFDWREFVHRCARARLGAAILPFMRYLASELELPLPQGLEGELEALSREVGAEARAAGRFARQSGGLRKLAALAGLVARPAGRRLARELLFADASFLRWAYGVESGAAASLLRLYHPVRFFTLHAAGRLSGRR
jgi:hypothetical protein